MINSRAGAWGNNPEGHGGGFPGFVSASPWAPRPAGLPGLLPLRRVPPAPEPAGSQRACRPNLGGGRSSLLRGAGERAWIGPWIEAPTVREVMGALAEAPQGGGCLSFVFALCGTRGALLGEGELVLEVPGERFFGFSPV